MNVTVQALASSSAWEWWPAAVLIGILIAVAYGVDRLKH
jgi:hypothetical protein